MLKKKTKAICTIIALAVLLGAIALVGETTGTTSMLRTVLQMGAIYALLAVSMNLCNGMTGLFSLGQAGFMTLGAYVYGMLTIPPASRNQVYYLYGVADWLKNLEMPIPVAMILGGLVAALFAFLIGIPVLRLKSDYLAIATLGFAEVVRIVVASSPLNRVTNGSMGMTMIPGFKSYYGIFVVVIVCIALIALLMRSTYGRAFKAIRDDEIAAEAMGINLTRHDGHHCGDVLHPADRGDRRAGQHHRQRDFCHAGDCVPRMVAAVFGSDNVHWVVPGAAAENRIPDGGIFRNPDGGGAVLPAGHYGRPGIFVGRRVWAAEKNRR